MNRDPSERGLVWLLGAKMVCCGGLVLAASGALNLASLAGWLLDSGVVWFSAAGLALAMIYLWRRQRAKQARSEHRKRAGAARSAT